MADKGKATISTVEAISMLDPSSSESELEWLESENGCLGGDGQDENDEQEAAGCTDESQGGLVTATDLCSNFH